MRGGALRLSPTLERKAATVTQEEAQKLEHGLYRIYWLDSDDLSIASVGSLHDGTRWFAPTNWTAKCEHGIASTKWDLVSNVVGLSYDW
jgi:hypothetical protein